MKRIAITIAALATLSAFAQPAQPTPGAHAEHRGMVRLDTNKDGLVDKTEAASHSRLAQDFDTMDTNKDGKLSPQELQAGRGKHQGGAHGMKHARGEGFASLDANKDGFLDRAELAARPRMLEHFAQLDTDKDQRLSQTELQSGRQQGQHRGAGHGDHQKPGAPAAK